MTNSIAPSFDFRNDSGEEVPGFGIVRITETETGGNGQQILVGDKPDGTDGIYYVNGPSAVPAGSAEDPKYGRCFLPTVAVFTAYDDAETPANGEEWGPVSGSWLLTESGSGFNIIGGATDGRVLVSAVGGGGCNNRNEVWLLQVDGSGGTFDIDLTLNGTTETLTFDYNDTAAAVQSVLESHSEAIAGDFAASGGPFPGVSITLEFQGNFAESEMLPPVIDNSNITDGTGLRIYRYTPGYPN